LFAARPNGSFRAPPGAFGTLARVSVPTGSVFVYTSEFDERWVFGTGGQLTAIIDRNGLATTFGYTDGLLTAIATTDGNTVTVGTATVEYNRYVRFAESSGRTVDLNILLPIVEGPTWLQAISDAGGTRTFTGGAFVTGEVWGAQQTQYGYAPSQMATGFVLGAPGTNQSAYAVQPAAEWGLHSGRPWAPPFVAGPLVGGVRDPLAHPTSYALDPLGRTGATTFADGTSTIALRDANGLVTQFTDERQFTTGYRYDARGHMTLVSHPDGGRKSFGYARRTGDLLWAADSYQQKTVYGYDRDGNLTSVRDRLGNVTKYTYYDGDLRGLVKTVIDPRSEAWVTTYAYDGGRRLATVTDPYSNPTVYTYDSSGFGNVTQVTDAAGRKTVTQYDGLNRVRGVVDVYGAATAWTYDPQGRVLTATDPYGVTTKHEYDSRGLLTKATEAFGNPLARTTWYDYDAAGNRVVEWDPRAYDTGGGTGSGEPFWTKTVTAYDSRNRATLTTAGAAYSAFDLFAKSGPPDLGALARTTRLGYDTAGNVIWVETSPSYADAGTFGYPAYRDTFAYDPVGRVTRATTGLVGTRTGPNPEAGWTDSKAPGRSTATVYDRNGNAWWTQASDGTVTVTAF
ncbi:MAG TPA: hypothetical protein VGE74_13740, partial [Gemmata sp.]